MAVITPSSIISEIRGSIGDQTYSKNRSGAYVKQKLIQPASDTPAQQNIRAAVTQANSFWKALTPSVQKSFEVYALENARAKSISRKVRLAGYNEYVSRWLNMFVTGSFNSSFNPYPKLSALVNISSIVIGFQSITLNWTATETLNDHWLILQCTAPTSSGVTSFNGRLHRTVLATEISGTSGSVEFYFDYISVFPILITDVGSKINVKASLISPINWTRTIFSQQDLVITSDIVAPLPDIVESQSTAMAGGGNISVTFANTILDGDLIVHVGFRQGSGGVPLMSGYTNLFQDGGGSFATRVQYRKCDGTESQTVTINMTNTGDSFVMALLIRDTQAVGFITLIGGRYQAGTSINAHTGVFNIPALSVGIYALVLFSERTLSSINQSFLEQINVKLTPGVPADGFIFVRSTDTGLTGINPTAAFTASADTRPVMFYVS